MTDLPTSGAQARADADPAVAALAALFTASRALGELMDRELRRVSGLSIAQVEVLVILGGAPEGRLRMAEVARAVRVSRSGATQIVQRLVAAGLVEQTVGAHDRRTVWASITDTGRAMERTTRPVFAAQAHHHLTDRLAPRRVTELRNSLLALVDNLA